MLSRLVAVEVPRRLLIDVVLSLQFCMEKKSDNSKNPENFQNGRAPRASRAARAHFWKFPEFSGIFRLELFFPYNTVQYLGPAFEGRKKLVFWFFAFFAKFRPASGEPSLGFGAPFWATGVVFTARGLEKRKIPKNFESRDKCTHTCTYIFVRTKTCCAPPTIIGA